MPIQRPLAGAALRAHETGECPAPPAPKGNQRALKHGAQTESLVSPRRDAHLRLLRMDYAHLDHRRLALLADRLARIDLATEWLEKQRGLVRNAKGEVYNVAVLVDKWSTRAEQVLREAEAERRRPRRIDLAQDMAALDEDAS